MNESLAASAAKVTAVTTGAAYSMVASSGAVGQVAGVLAATYSAIQIFKALPWMTDYIVAIRNGVFRKDWSRWHVLQRRTEKGGDDNDIKP
jgi:hypothetical protein